MAAKSFDEIRALLKRKYVDTAISLLELEGDSDEAIRFAYTAIHQSISMAVSWIKRTDREFATKISHYESFVNIKEIDWEAQRLTDVKVSLEEHIYWKKYLPHWVEEEIVRWVGGELDQIDDALRDHVGMRWLEIATGMHPHLQSLKRRSDDTFF